MQVQLFADLLTVINPGRLFGAVSIDTLGTSGITSTRNAVLMQLLGDAVMPGTGEAMSNARRSNRRRSVPLAQSERTAGQRFVIC